MKISIRVIGYKLCLTSLSSWRFGLRFVLAWLRHSTPKLRSNQNATDKGVREQRMGMAANLIGIGAFKNELIGHFEYPAQYYKNTKEGMILTRELFGIYEGSSVSREFASFLGINDAWDFNQHKLDSKKIDFEGLQDFCCNRYSDYM